MSKILICTPSHDSKVHVDYMRGCLDLQKAFKGNPDSIDFFWQEGGSDIVKAREDILWFWYHETKHDYMLFMDSDQGFSADTLKHLLETERGRGEACVVAAPVPLKRMKQERLLEYVADAMTDAQAPFNREHMFPVTWDYNFAGDHQIGSLEDEYILQVERVGTGCMLISRKVIDTWLVKMEAEEQPFYGSDSYTSRVTKEKCYTLFSHLIMGEKILGEDYSFCVRMLLADIPVLVDLRCNLTHYGNFGFEGNVFAKKEYLQYMKNTTKNTP